MPTRLQGITPQDAVVFNVYGTPFRLRFSVFRNTFRTFLVYMRRSGRCRRHYVKGSHCAESQQNSCAVISRYYEVASHRPPEAWLLHTKTKFKYTAGIASPSLRMSLVFSILTCQIQWKRLPIGLATVALLPSMSPACSAACQ